MSITYDLDCGDEVITLELLDDGTLISYGFDIESELIAREMGFEPHPCFVAMDHALLQAAQYGRDIDIVEILLAAGADVHVFDDGALRWAAEEGHANVVKLLLEYGADVHALSDNALRLAANNGHSDVVKLLLEYGADVHAGDNYALRLAVAKGHSDVVNILKNWIRDHG